MKTKAVRLYGKNDLRLEEFELPPLREDEILAKVVSDSICMSSHKAALQGEEHKRVPNDVRHNPVIIGHEFCGELVDIGPEWRHKFRPGQRFIIQPALNYKGSLESPGYSYRYIGGDATYVIMPREVMEMDCLLDYEGEAFFAGSLAEPYSCVIGAFHASYHITRGSYAHHMGIRQGGSLAILAGAGPMGLAAIDYLIHCGRTPKLLVVTDIDERRLSRAEALLTPEEAAKYGITLMYKNTSGVADQKGFMLGLNGGAGYDDVFVFAPVAPVVELADDILAADGCLNFFAGPGDPAFRARLNFYNVHYGGTHVAGTSGGNTDDLREMAKMAAEGRVSPAFLVTHVGGLDAVVDTTMNLPAIPGGKKLIYTHLSLPLTAIADFREKGASDPFFKALDEITARHGGLWNAEAERYLIKNAKPI